MQATKKVVFTAKDLSELGFSRAMAYRLLNRKDMPVVKIGRNKFMNARMFLERLDELADERAN